MDGAFAGIAEFSGEGRLGQEAVLIAVCDVGGIERLGAGGPCGDGDGGAGVYQARLREQLVCEIVLAAPGNVRGNIRGGAGDLHVCGEVIGAERDPSNSRRGGGDFIDGNYGGGSFYPREYADRADGDPGRVLGAGEYGINVLDIFGRPDLSDAYGVDVRSGYGSDVVLEQAGFD